MSKMDHIKTSLVEKNEQIARLEAALRCVRAMLDQPVQYTDMKDAPETRLSYTVHVLRGDCKAVRDFITHTLDV